MWNVKKKEASIDPLNCWVGSVRQLESNDSTLELNTSVILSHPAGVREGFHPLSKKGLVTSGRWYLGTVCGCPVAEEKESERPMKSKPCSFFVSYRWGEIWGKNSLPPRTSSFLFGSLGDPAWSFLALPITLEKERRLLPSFVHDACTMLLGEDTMQLRSGAHSGCLWALETDWIAASKPPFEKHMWAQRVLWKHLTSLCVHRHGPSGCCVRALTGLTPQRFLFF